MTEEEKYWQRIEEKTKEVLEVLKGTSYTEFKHILSTLNSRVKNKVESTTI